MSKCPYKLPLESYYNTIGEMWLIKNREGKILWWDLTEQQATYIVQVINRHEKLVDLAKDLDSGLKYLRTMKCEVYGFGIDRFEKKLQALAEAEKQ